MKPLVTTVRALSELATGLSPDAVSSSAVLYKYGTEEVDCLLAANDDQGVQRIVVMREQNAKEPFVPEHLVSLRRDVLSRMKSFAERARTPGPLNLPRQWHQYKFNNYIAFRATSKIDSLSSRWITEVTSGDRADIIFWTTTTSDNKSTLEEFDSRRPAAPDLDAVWLQAVAAAQDHFAQLRSQPADVEMSLPALEQSTTKGWTYEQWLGAISKEQRAFIDADTDKSIRLRGPAGSGKTLALTLKAIREVLKARQAGGDLRVLVVTHSWALAAQISDSIDSMGLDLLPEIDVFPLLEIAKTISPQYVQDVSSGFSLIGEDSLSGKQAQLDMIQEVLDEFITGDWITYKGRVSESLRMRFGSADDERRALAWDLLIEFGSVIGAAAIFPGAGSDLRYFQLPRASWMLPLNSREDSRVVFELYTRYWASLDERALTTSDQVLADFLIHLSTNTWNRARRVHGYDLVFVDEFHLFSPLERQVLHYLTRDTSVYPRVFMAVDPRQSPSEAFIGLAADETRSSSGAPADDGLGDVTNFELTTVHRFTPQILELIKHVHHEFPTLNLGQDWDIDFTRVESAQADGSLPRLISAASRAGEEGDIIRAVQDLYSSGRLALAVVDFRQWPRFSRLASQIGHSGKFHVSTVSGRSDIEGLGYRRRGLVVGTAEYLAGLQFDTVLVAGIPDLNTSVPTANERIRYLSLLYLALSRAHREVRVFVNEDDDGGAPEVLLRAVNNQLMESTQGSRI
ncbi:UvrD-helicase domain-containing protein [Streptomyces sp. S465]|uniref:UvrD-helicase domain-containing protein n=1 Tax=Streptomyces sp. S465 TaxID=2979468 RepID=UPI0022A87196|nr:UvrD-helicase domain-containing protein [Streptomyces sp. S465]WAP57989.1 AAA family ATPase [Streptomyces sp. S465]